MNQKVQAIGISLSKDLETEGFDLQAGRTWIYPTNYPIRDYQYNIVQQALFKNTLVSLPTGLGKTFIAAVVMYNFFRWYPNGKIIFMAPTRPLVKQQIEACYDIMAIPKNVTVELTGAKMSSSREDIWKDKRVFFITPQILQNDLAKVTGLAEKIKCLVFDEAHRARGNHAYCEVIRKIKPYNKYFRILALSATPGSTTSDVLEVVQNLSISHLEFRSEESLDVQPYVFERNLITVVVPLGEKLLQVRDDYMKVLEYYTRTLVKYKVIQGNCGNLTKGKIFMTLKEFQQKSSNSSSNYAEIMKSLNICITLYHGFELLIRHGLRSFLSFFDEHAAKPLLKGNSHLIKIMNDIREYLGPKPLVEQLPDGSFLKIPSNVKFGHPKYYKLRDILLSHFTTESDPSKVIVFFEYRNSAMEAYALLNQEKPLLNPRIFVGQGRGNTQRQQLSVIESYKEGHCNILLSTCIGEEGLDIGEVDMIICFDISSKSPIRMVQRMGRTGRKREGKIFALVTEGREQQILKDCLIHKNNIALDVLSSKELAKCLISDWPRLVPSEIEPKCDKIYITTKESTVSKKNSLKDMFRNKPNGSAYQFSPNIKIEHLQEKIPFPQYLWNKGNPLDRNLKNSNLCSRKLEKQRSLQSFHLIKHSPTTELLVCLLQHADSKRFNIPDTQIGQLPSLTQCKNLKQTDIRHMFNKFQSSKDFLKPNSANNVLPQQAHFTLELSVPSKNLLAEIIDFLSIEFSDDKIMQCRHCPDNFDCTNLSIISGIKKINSSVQDELFTAITLDDINLFFELDTMKLEKSTHYNTSTKNYKDSRETYLIKSPHDKKDEKINFSKTLNFDNYNTSTVNIKDYSQEEYTNNNNNIKQIYDSFEKVDVYFKKSKDLLHFFKLNFLIDLFSLNDGSVRQDIIFDNSNVFENKSIRMINSDLSSDQREKNKLAPKNFEDYQKKVFNTLPTTCLNLSNSIATTKKADEDQKEKPKLKKLIDAPLHSETNNLNNVNNNINENSIDIDDICDLSVFGLSTSENFMIFNKTQTNKNDELSNNSIKINLNINDICDLKMFGMKNKRSDYDCIKEQTFLPEKSITITQIIDLVSDSETAGKEFGTEQNYEIAGLRSKSDRDVSFPQSKIRCIPGCENLLDSKALHEKLDVSKYSQVENKEKSLERTGSGKDYREYYEDEASQYEVENS